MRTSGGLAGATARLRREASREARRAPLWTPVLFGLGVWLYFAAPVEPAVPLLAAAGAAAGAAFLALLRPGAPVAALAAAGCVCAGFANAGLRAHLVAAPVMPAAMTALVEGRVRAISQSASGRPRATLDAVFVYGLAPEDAPARLRLSFRAGDAIPPPGARLSVMARIGPPSPPVEPGGFDFRRVAWFERIGGVGVARGPIALSPAGEGGFTLARDRLRRRLAEALRARMPGEAGAFAAALAVGDRSAVPQDALQALRDSNLAHLLAISGLHMGLLCGAAFVALRLALALVPRAALFLPIRRIAAAGALAVGAAYLMMSGAGTPTQRAFVMAAAALIAAMTNRPAVTPRALALAAFVVLGAAPESLLSAGFRMSFAATLALVAAYETARAWRWFAPGRGAARRLGRYAAALALTTLIAGLATAPFAAESFNRLTRYGFAANLAATPALGLWVAPALLSAAVAAPFGLEQPFLAAAGRGVDWILAVARFFAGLEGAVRPVAAAPPLGFALVVLGGLWLCLWRSRMRLAGAPAVALGVALWAAGAPRPDALIAPGGALIGVQTPAGRSLDHADAAGYAARSWLRRDGDAAEQADAAARPLWRRDGSWAEAPLGAGWRLTRLEGAAPRAVLLARCAPRTVLVTPDRFAPEGDCLGFDRRRLAETGAVAIDMEGGAPRLTLSAEVDGGRLWSGAAQ